MSPEKTTVKPELNREQLRGHGIDFFEEVSDIEELDNWLQPICHAITRLHRAFPEPAREIFDQQLSQFRLRGQDRDDARKEHWCLRPLEDLDYLQPESYIVSADRAENLRPAKWDKALREVQLCRARNENEEKWTQVLLEHVFWDFYKVNSGSTPYEQKLNGWELHQNVLWNEFPRWARLNPKIARLTLPKPDLTYGFPVILPNDETFRYFKDDDQVNTFSLPVLGELRNKEKGRLISTPTTAVYNWAASKNAKLPEAKDLMCFPWAIVEVKRGTAEPKADSERKEIKAEARDHKRREQFCYCQAANASAAALTLREHLAARAKDSSNLQNARVMFSFTCVGSAVKLWVTYRKKLAKSNDQSQQRCKEGRIVMLCIWATSLELSWGIMALQMIVRNMEDWVCKSVKPVISRWIHDVRQNQLQISSLTPSGDTVVQRRRAASCGLSKEKVNPEDSALLTMRGEYHTPQGKARPTLPHFMTAPEPLGRRLAKSRVPKIQVNGSTERDREEIEESSDEGYASIHSRRLWNSKEGREETSYEDEKKALSAFICKDKLFEDDSDAPYVPSSSEDESTGSEDLDDEESNNEDGHSDEHSSERGENDDEYDFSDSESDHRRSNPQSSAFARLEVYCTPTKNYKSSKRAESSSKRDRRRSSRF